jgi:hypothetical protein
VSQVDAVFRALADPTRRSIFEQLTRGEAPVKTLSPTATGGTHLRLEHTGFLPTNAYAFKGADLGWRNKFLPKLAETVATVIGPSGRAEESR